MPTTSQAFSWRTEAGEGTGNHKLGDEPADGSDGRVDFGTSTTLRWIGWTPGVVDNTTPNQTANPDGVTNKGWNILDADMQEPGQRRVIKAGTWSFEFSVDIDVADLGQNIYRVGVNAYRYTVSSGAKTKLFWQFSNTFEPAVGGQAVTMDVTGQPDFLFTDDETLHLEFWAKGRGAAITGRKATFEIGTPGIPARPARVSLPAGIRTVWSKSVAGATTPSGLLIPKAKIIRSGAATPAGALTQLPKLLRAGSMTPAGALLNNTKKAPFTGVVAPAGALLKNVKKPNLAGVVTPGAGALTNLPKLLRTGAVSPTGALLKKVTPVPFAGSISPAGSLLKNTKKPLDGTITPGPGVLTQKIAKIITGALSPTGALILMPKRFFAGSVSPTGALLKNVKKPNLAGAITPVGDLDNDYIAVRLFTGSISPGPGTLTEKVQKVLEGVISPTGEATTKLFKVTAGTISPTGALIKEVQKLFEACMDACGEVTPVTEEPIFVVIDDG